MSKARPVTLLVAAAAVTAASAATFKSEAELAVFGPYGATADVSSAETCVAVGTNVWTYSPELIDLYLSESLVADTEILSGWHPGRARCLKKNGPKAEGWISTSTALPVTT